MPFTDKNGHELNISDQVIILGTVSSLHGDLGCFVDFVKYGSAVSMAFARTEPILATFEEGQVTGTITGDPVDKDDAVMLLGTITELAPGIHDVAIVQLVENAEVVELTLYCNELTFANVDQGTGVISGDTG